MTLDIPLCGGYNEKTGLESLRYCDNKFYNLDYYMRHRNRERCKFLKCMSGADEYRNM